MFGNKRKILKFGLWDCNGVVISLAPRKAAGFDSLEVHNLGINP